MNNKIASELPSLQGNIVLVGMPGAGKSACGKLLASRLQLQFIDTDGLIEQRHGASLQQILELHDYHYLRALEEQVLLSSDWLPAAHGHAVIATGGSAVYSAAGIARLKASGTIVYLYCQLNELEKRIDNFHSRGIASAAGETLEQLALQRTPLYERCADTTIDVSKLQISQVVHEIMSALEPGKKQP